jgi:hypothetical protein
MNINQIILVGQWHIASAIDIWRLWIEGRYYLGNGHTTTKNTMACENSEHWSPLENVWRVDFFFNV